MAHTKDKRPTAMEKLLNVSHSTTLASRTSTNTDITSADFTVTEFAQVSSKERAVVFGSPYLSGR